MSTPKRIEIRVHDPHYGEGRAGAAITPGHLIELEGNAFVEGRPSDVVVHSTANGAAEKCFAIEDGNQGKTIADAYASGDIVPCVFAKPGDEVYAWLLDEENVAVNDKLSSAGNGALQAYAGTAPAIAVVVEALDLTGAAADARIRVRVL